MRFPHPFIDGFMPYKPPWIPPPWSILHYRTALILLIAFFRFTTSIPIVNDPQRIFHSNLINCHANIITTTIYFPTTFTTSTTLSLTMIRGDTTSSLLYDGFIPIVNDPQRIFHSNLINCHANIANIITTTTYFPTTFTTSTTLSLTMIRGAFTTSTILSLTMIRGDTTSSLYYDGFHFTITTTSFPTTFTTSTILSLTMIRGDTTSSLHYDGFHFTTTTTSFPTTFTTSTILSLTMIRGDTTSSLHYDGNNESSTQILLI